MSYENWKDKIGTFEVMDVRGKKMDFFPALKADDKELFCIMTIQTVTDAIRYVS